MNISTGREFSFRNPQDDQHLYPKPPPGFYLDYQGNLKASPGTRTPRPKPQPAPFARVTPIEEIEEMKRQGLIPQPESREPPAK